MRKVAMIVAFSVFLFLLNNCNKENSSPVVNNNQHDTLPANDFEQIHVYKDNDSTKSIIIKDLFIDKNDNLIVWTGANDILLSSNDGSSWKKINASMSSDTILYFFACKNGNMIYKDSRLNTYMSSNSGEDWVKIAEPPSMVRGNNPFIFDNSDIYYWGYGGDYKQELYISHNYGKTWEKSDLNFGWIYSMTSNDAGYVVASINESDDQPEKVSVYLTTNRGKSWVKIKDATDKGTFLVKILNIDQTGRIFFSERNRGNEPFAIWFTNDLGKTFSCSIDSLPVITSNLIESQGGNYYINGYGYDNRPRNTFYKSTNQGLNWKPVSQYWYLDRIAINSRGTIFGINNPNLYRSKKQFD